MSETLHMVSGRYRKRPESFPPAQIDPAKHQPIPWLSHVRIGNMQAFWMQIDDDKPVVNQECFTELSSVHLMQLKRGERAHLGRVVAKDSPRNIASALIESEVIQTYVHIESRVHFVATRQQDKLWRVSFAGEHVYYTNEENIDAFRLSILIEEDGNLYVEHEE